MNEYSGTSGYDPQSQLDNELAGGERVTWSAQPIPWRISWPAWFVVLFGIPWTAFALFWMWGASGFGMDFPAIGNGGGPFQFVQLIFPLFGLPFVLIGLGMFSAPYWAYRAAKRTVYALTDRRAIIIKGGFWKSLTVKSYEPRLLNEVERKQYADGSGNLLFTINYTRNNDGDRTMTHEGFYAIENVKQVEELLRAMIAANSEKQEDEVEA